MTAGYYKLSSKTTQYFRTKLFARVVVFSMNFFTEHVSACPVLLTLLDAIGRSATQGAAGVKGVRVQCV